MHFLDQLSVGQVRCVFTSQPRTREDELLAWGAELPEGERVVVCEVNAADPVAVILDGFVTCLARASLAVWPDWYGCIGLFAPRDEQALQGILDQITNRRVASMRHAVLMTWLSRAAASCRAGALPVVGELSPTVQVQQLAGTLAETALVIGIRVECPRQPAPGCLAGLARAVEWLSQQVSARLIVFLPTELLGANEFDNISWNHRVVGDLVEPDRPGRPATDEPSLVVGPIRGRPHPLSPGEQLLAARLARDPQLGPLFDYNCRCNTVRGSCYMVDLVWQAGKVVVEIDGYRYHSTVEQFSIDRERDYELQISGYMVLRLTHSSVIEDVELAIDKIRDFVNFRLHQPSPQR